MSLTINPAHMRLGRRVLVAASALLPVSSCSTRNAPTAPSDPCVWVVDHWVCPSKPPAPVTDSTTLSQASTESGSPVGSIRTFAVET